MDWNGSWWMYLDWLLIGVFLFMSLTIIAGANLRSDALIVFVGLVGGLVIEAWGTQTNLWIYYTAERPPLWIIPAWPISALSIDRMTRLLNLVLIWSTEKFKKYLSHSSWSSVSINLYWLTFVIFLALMLKFVGPTLDKSFTLFALLLCVILTLTPTNHRYAFITFFSGSSLGYFLELWGTTRECWTYYTHQTPPLFAVLAHGMAAVAFWRSGLYIKGLMGRFKLVGWYSIRELSK